MNLPGLVFLFAIYTLVVAAVVVATLYVVRRRRRGSDQNLPIPNVAGLNLKPTVDPNIAAWFTREPGARPEAPLHDGDPAPPAVQRGTLGASPRPSASGLARRTPRYVERKPLPYPDPNAKTDVEADVVEPALDVVPPDRSAAPLELTTMSAEDSARRSVRAASTNADGGTDSTPILGEAPASTVEQLESPTKADEGAEGTATLSVGEVLVEPATDASFGGIFARVFGADGALLPEGLRTLEVSPNRIIEPNAVVRVALTFRNPGGGVASGFRARFCMPAGLTYTADSARIGACPLADEEGRTALLEGLGADIGDVPAGGECRISLEFTVAGTIENGTAVAIQAAIASADVPVIGSNIVRLIVRSSPVLQNSSTTLDLVSLGAALPGKELALTARVHNSGQSSAHDLIVLLPVPTHTTFAARSVTIDGRPFAGDARSVPFGFGRPTVVAAMLVPGATVEIGYRVRIDTPLEDGTPIVARGTVCSREVGEFALPPVTLEIHSAASFEGEETTLDVACADEVQPGERLRILLKAKNIGTAAARAFSLAISLPEGMLYTAGSLAIDAELVPDRGALPAVVRLGDLGPGRAVKLELMAIVQSPLPNGHKLRAAAKVTWSKGERDFARDLRVRSAPRFPPAFNTIERESAQRVGPGDIVSFVVTLVNLGNDIATGARLKLNADPGLEELRAHDADSEIPIGADLTVSLDTLEPGVSRLLRLSGRVAGIIEDQKQLRLHAALQTDQVSYSELGAQVHVVESRPTFSAATSRISVDAPAFSLQRRNTCRLVLVNEGTDSGRDVRVALSLPEALRLEGVDHATRDGDSVEFGDIAAGEKREAILYLRLVGILAHGEPLEIAARVGGLNVVPFSMHSVQLATRAEASFIQGATLTSEPTQTADAGGQIRYTLSLRNSGDGTAKCLTARIVLLTNAVYAQGSTTVNTVALQDHAGTSLLLSESGLRLADVWAGVEIVASWRAIVNMPLPPGAAIESAVSIRWDSAEEFTIAAQPIAARSTSALPIIDPALPFSVLGAIAARGSDH